MHVRGMHCTSCLFGPRRCFCCMCLESHHGPTSYDGTRQRSKQYITQVLVYVLTAPPAGPNPLHIGVPCDSTTLGMQWEPTSTSLKE
jgi:hypothetical protein